MPEQVLYVSQGKMFLHDGQQSRPIESRFGNEIRQRALELQKRHEWKKQGTGAQFMMGALAFMQPRSEPDEIPITISGISRGCHEGELLYTLRTPEIAGVFSLRAGATEEQRLFHSAEIRPEQVTAHPERKKIACVLTHRNGTATIGVMNHDCSDLTEVTQGDCLDGAPRWVPGPAEQIVFHSAGMGRDASGRFVGHAPYAVYRLNLQTGEMQCLAEDPKHDLLAPQMNEAGELVFIRRPHLDVTRRLPVWRLMLDLLLLPYRLLAAIFSYLNFFSARYTGKTLVSSGGARAQTPDANQVWIHGNLVQADKRMRAKAGDDAPPLVPSDWQLVRRMPDGAERVLASSVLAFDLVAGGGIVYTNGRAAFRLDSEGTSHRLLKDGCIENLIAIPATA